MIRDPMQALLDWLSPESSEWRNGMMFGICASPTSPVPRHDAWSYWRWGVFTVPPGRVEAKQIRLTVRQLGRKGLVELKGVCKARKKHYFGPGPAVAVLSDWLEENGMLRMDRYHEMCRDLATKFDRKAYYRVMPLAYRPGGPFLYKR